MTINKTQKIISFITCTSLILYVFMLFPFNGLDIKEEVFIENNFRYLCPMLDESYSAKEMDEHYQKNKNDPIWMAKVEKYCNSGRIETKYFDFSDWRSNSPIVHWFGNIKNFMIACVFTIIIGAMGIYIFKN